jgi:hypothetical protein
MSMKITTNGKVTPSTLLDQIYKGIEQKQIQTWSIRIHEGAKYLTHTPPQWTGKGFLFLSADSLALNVRFIEATGVQGTDELKGVYQGRFAEMLYAHDQQTFSGAVATILISVD